MEITTRKTILNDLKDELEINLNQTSGYDTTVLEVKSGIYLFEDFQMRPAISFWGYQDKVIEYLMGHNKIRKLYIYLYCFSDTDGITNTDNIYKLINDVEVFLASDQFTYSNEVTIDQTTIYPGGVQDQSSIGLIEFNINYNQE